MYAVIASGVIRLVDTAEEVNVLKAIYPYAKTHYAQSKEEAQAWINQNTRKRYDTRVVKFGTTAWTRYVDIFYWIDKNNIFYNLDIRNFGRTRIDPAPDVVVDNRNNYIKVKILGVRLNDMLIQHHAIAIKRILILLGNYCDVNINVPDMSIYIALTDYIGKDRILLGVKDLLKERLGGVSFTVK